MKVFLDTNIIIDFYDERPSFFDAAAQIIAMAYRKEIEIVVSATSFINAFCLLRKSYEHEDLVKAMSGLADLCTISDITKQMIKHCLNGMPIDFEDAMQMESAASERADLIVTRNVRHFKGGSIPVKTPVEFLTRSN